MTSSTTHPKLRYASDPTPSETTAVTPRLKLGSINQRLPLEKRGREVLRLAEIAFSQTGSWVVFYREMLGVDGVVRRLFPDAEQLRFFEGQEEFIELQEMVAAMRSQDPGKSTEVEPERMVTIRLPKSVHEVLLAESEDMELSINQLSICKLLQPVDTRFVPLQRGRRRGRKPGPQGKRKSAN